MRAGVGLVGFWIWGLWKRSGVGVQSGGGNNRFGPQTFGSRSKGRRMEMREVGRKKGVVDWKKFRGELEE